MRLKIFCYLLLVTVFASGCSLSALLDPNASQPFSDPETLPDEPAPGEGSPSVSEAQPNPPAESSPALATPVGDSPTAGICAEFGGQWVTVTIRPDIPDPRCAFIRADQMLEVVNERGETLQVGIGTMGVELAPGESYRFEVAFGDYLMPGVHRISVEPCCGGELWFKDGGE